MNPLVSIITPSFNQGRFIEETILSVINQKYDNIEYIIIDGGSTDNTECIIEKYREHISIFIKEPDGGQSDAINKGLRLASGEYLTWLNSDDTLNDEAILSVISEFNINGQCQFVYGDVDMIDENSVSLHLLKGKQITRPDVFYKLDLPIPQQGAVWKRSVLDEIGFLNEKWHYVLDREFFLRIVLGAEAKYIPKVLGNFRQHGHSKSVAMKNAWVQELPRMYDDFIKLHNWTYSHKITKKVRSSSRIHAAYLAFASRDFYLGFKYIVSAFSIDGFIFSGLHIYAKPVNRALKFFRKLKNAN